MSVELSPLVLHPCEQSCGSILGYSFNWLALPNGSSWKSAFLNFLRSSGSSCLRQGPYPLTNTNLIHWGREPTDRIQFFAPPGSAWVSAALACMGALIYIRVYLNSNFRISFSNIQPANLVNPLFRDWSLVFRSRSREFIRAWSWRKGFFLPKATFGSGTV